MPSPTLHITNGDGAVGLLRTLLGPVDILPWRDILHEGPVPAGLNRYELSAVRATYLSGMSGYPFAEIMDTFRQRDRLIDKIEERKRVVIWLEHDLVDQLQLLQILSQLPVKFIGDGHANLAQADKFLGEMELHDAQELQNEIADVTAEQQSTAIRLWTAVCASTPNKLASNIMTEIDGFPYMRAALERMLQELPSSKNGLNRTEQQILSILDRGPIKARRLFGAAQELEEARFMGDLSFFNRLDRLMRLEAVCSFSGPAPLRHSSSEEFLDTTLSLTDLGQELLAGRVDWLNRSNLDEWLGGSYLANDRYWRWDQNRKQVIAY